jgi:tRNA(fMet)-specific endonuclease VapC
MCWLVAAELWYGCARSAKPVANHIPVDALMAPFLSLPYTDTAADHFDTDRRSREMLGQVISPYGMQIAAIALANACTLVTQNIGEFNRDPGFAVEDWEFL